MRMDTPCNCSCSVDDYDQMEGGSTRVSTARKVHRCCECHEQIQPGQRYERVTGSVCGEWWTYRTCMPCLSIRQYYCPHGWGFTTLRETIMNCMGFDYLIANDVADWAEAEDAEAEARQLMPTNSFDALVQEVMIDPDARMAALENKLHRQITAAFDAARRDRRRLEARVAELEAEIADEGEQGG